MSLGVGSTAFSRVVAVAASIGGLQVVTMLLSALPADFPAPVLVVQHRGPGSTARLAEVLARRSALPVREARDGDDARAGTVYVAPPDRHVTLEEGFALALSDGPKQHYTRPAADPLFRSVAALVGRRAIGVVMTGRGEDGAAGAAAIRRAGGLVLVQEPGTCVSPHMPRAVLADSGADFLLRPDKIADALVSLVMVPGVSAALFGLPPGTISRPAA